MFSVLQGHCSVWQMRSVILLIQALLAGKTWTETVVSSLALFSLQSKLYLKSKLGRSFFFFSFFHTIWRYLKPSSQACACSHRV